ncbi:MAG: hypothetical protein FJX31_08360 [Alphaproteobacteria bacterium]|nr:hypothetical protein [Alphaproteobacteria bacterium]
MVRGSEPRKVPNRSRDAAARGRRSLDSRRELTDRDFMVAEAKGSYQAPKSVVFVDAIPQTPVGKPDKKALRAAYAP